MNIGINATSFSNNPSGAKDRFIQIYSSLFDLDKINNYVVFQPKGVNLENSFPYFKHVDFISTNIHPDKTIMRFLYGIFFWKKALSNYKIDIFDTNYLPINKNHYGKTVFTIYDLRYLSPYSSDSIVRSLLFKFFFSRALRKSDFIITISEAMKNHLLELYPNVNPIILPCSTDIHKEQLSSATDLDQSCNQYILAVGHLERRKNILRLIDAFNIVLKNGYKGSLYIISNGGSEKKDIVKYILKSGLTRKVKIIPNVSRAELARYYKKADLFVFPSLYEGFGIPILEAMSLGCPYVISNIDVFREVAGNDSVYFDPISVNDISKKIELVLWDNSIRKRLIEIGKKRFKDYSSDKIAKDYLTHILNY
jgi:glycosyltransferase involved in cell wall biosynthesis